MLNFLRNLGFDENHALARRETWALLLAGLIEGAQQAQLVPLEWSATAAATQVITVVFAVITLGAKLFKKGSLPFSSALLAGVLAASLMPAPAMAQPPTWSFQRASLGADAKGAIFDREGANTSAFLPGAYLSYSVTSGLSVAGTVERDFANDLTIGQAGLRFLMFHQGDGQVAAGVNVVGYGDTGASGLAEPTSWNASVHGSYSVWRSKYDGRTVAWGVLSASHDPENSLTIYRAGLRVQVLGGKPY